MTRRTADKSLSATRAARIRRARLEKGLSQKALADLCGLTQRQITYLENPDALAAVFLHRAPKMAEVLGVSPRWLLGESNRKTPPKSKT